VSDAMTKIAPSILSADFSNLAGALEVVERGEAEIVHLDVMDGHFVPNITIGPPVVRSLRPVTDKIFDCHLMIEEPQRFIPDFLKAGANMIAVHAEAERHLDRAVRLIRDGGAKAGVALNPATPVEVLVDVLDRIDYVLLMTVNPGFGGQSFIASVVEKIVRLRDVLRRRALAVEIEVDGGIDPTTAPRVVAAGATILVAGSAIFGQPDPVKAIESLRLAATTAAV